jgi:hypothetical protein
MWNIRNTCGIWIGKAKACAWNLDHNNGGIHLEFESEKKRNMCGIWIDKGREIYIGFQSEK